MQVNATNDINNQTTQTMQDPSNDRVISLLKSLEIGEMDLARLIGKPASTVYRITKKETIPSRATLQLIAQATKASFEWLLSGEGDMFAPGGGAAGMGLSISRALDTLKEQLQKKDEQIDFLTKMLKFHVATGNPEQAKAVGFPKPLQKPDLARVIYMHHTTPAESVRATGND